MVSFLDRDWIRYPGREGIFYEDYCRIRLISELPYEPIMRVLIARHPASTVEIHDNWESLCAIPGPYYANIDVPIWPSADAHILDIGRHF
jgi:hypothetical protein